MTIENNPFEVGLDWIVDLDKRADFIGREALQRIKKDGVERKLVGVEIDGAPVEFNQTKWEVDAEGKRVGQITSAIHSPRLKKNIGYAMVPTDLSKLGTQFTAMTPWGNREATVVQKPFIDPKKDIPKS
jgi:aminomethyltransferase